MTNFASAKWFVRWSDYLDEVLATSCNNPTWIKILTDVKGPGIFGFTYM